MLELDNEQQMALDFLLNNPACYQMLDIGFGKTAVILKAIEATGHTALVCAPINVARFTWPEEIKKWTPRLSYTVLHGPRKKDRLRLNKRIYLLNYEGLKWFYNSIVSGVRRVPKMFMVWDESSFVKDPSTVRFKLFKKMHPMYSPFKVNMSGSPASNGYHNLWSQYHLLDRGKRLGSSYYSFRDRWFQYTGPPVFKTTPRPGAKKEIFEAVKDITFRIKGTYKKPRIKNHVLPVALPPRVYDQYLKFERDFFIEIQDRPITATSSAGVSNKLRQITQGALYDNEHDWHMVHTEKADALKDFVDMAQGNPVMCAIQFRFERDIIEATFKRHLPCLYGGADKNQVGSWIQQWNQGRIPLMLCHPLSVGYGMNFQFGGHIVVWYGIPWSLDQYEQLNGRLARRGQKNPFVTVSHIVAKATIDEIITKSLVAKDATQANLKEAVLRYSKYRLK